MFNPVVSSCTTLQVSTLPDPITSGVGYKKWQHYAFRACLQIGLRESQRLNAGFDHLHLACNAKVRNLHLSPTLYIYVLVDDDDETVEQEV